MGPRAGSAGPHRSVRGVAVAAGAAFLALSVPMQVWERRMRQTGGPGIVGLQLAGDPHTAQSVLTAWGASGRAAARQQTAADFVYLLTYAAAGWAGVELLRRRSSQGSGWDRTGRFARWLPVVAAGCDAAENVALLRTLGAPDRGRAPDASAVRLTAAMASTKFALLAASLGWAAGAALGTRGARSRSVPDGSTQAGSAQAGSAQAGSTRSR